MVIIESSYRYFEQYGIPNTPKDLINHQCIGYRLTTQGSVYAWEFVKDGQETKIKIQGQWIFNESYDIVEAVRAGFGLAYIPEDLIREDLKEGKLIQVLEEYSIQFPGYHLYYPHRRQLSPALRLVIDILRE